MPLDPHTILGIEKNASQEEIKKECRKILNIKIENPTPEEIKKAYKDMCMQKHPDKNKEVDPEIIKKIIIAYKILNGSEIIDEIDADINIKEFGRSFSDVQTEFIFADLGNIFNAFLNQRQRPPEKEIIDISLEEVYKNRFYNVEGVYLNTIIDILDNVNKKNTRGSSISFNITDKGLFEIFGNKLIYKKIIDMHAFLNGSSFAIILPNKEKIIIKQESFLGKELKPQEIPEKGFLKPKTVFDEIILGRLSLFVVYTLKEPVRKMKIDKEPNNSKIGKLIV